MHTLYDLGMYCIDIFKMVLGILTIIGALGFFVSTSPKFPHWPILIRRIFMGIFIFCNVINQLFFNVINVPNNKKLVCILGQCIEKIS